MKPKEHHGGTRTPEYSVWANMIRRCYKTNRKDYERYGGRGVTVCERWRESFAAFLADVGKRPGPGYSIERRENSKPYEPGNCFWATAKQQARNRRSSRTLTHDGVTRTMAEWCEIIGIGQSTLFLRIATGWSVEKALTTPLREWGPGRLKSPQ